MSATRKSTRVVDIERYDIALKWLFPDAEPDSLNDERAWLSPRFMDGDNLILSIHSLVLRVAGKVILVDTCVGEHKARPRHAGWNNRSATAYLARLTTVGLRPEDIDIVFCTHLHADHVGWNTRLLDGRWVPTFPNARYLIGKAELDHWRGQIAGWQRVGQSWVFPGFGAAGDGDRAGRSGGGRPRDRGGLRGPGFARSYAGPGRIGAEDSRRGSLVHR